MSDLLVSVDWMYGAARIGTLHRHARRGGEAVSLEYADEWIDHPAAYALDPGLPLGRGAFTLSGRRSRFGALSDCAPDTWGRRLMQRAERRTAERERRPIRTLQETDYLLGVSDIARVGALRFQHTVDSPFLAYTTDGVPPIVRLGDLLGAVERVLCDDDNDADLALILAPGSSLGGARPKASVLDQYSRLSIAKFPKDGDEYSIERWEVIALDIAAAAGINVVDHEMVTALGKPVLLSRRFDR